MGQTIAYTDPTVGLIPNVGIGSAAMNRWLKLFNTNPVTKIFGYIPISVFTCANQPFQIVNQWDFITISPLINLAVNNQQYVVTSIAGVPVNVPNPPRVFTLNVNELNNLLGGLTCTLCIRFNTVNSNGNVTVTRYRLNNPDNYPGIYSFEPVPYPDYIGQVILPYFSIEVWSNNNIDANVTTGANPINITTSIFNLVQDSFDPTNNTIVPPQNTTQLLSEETTPGFNMSSIPFVFPWGFNPNTVGNNNILTNNWP